jgi:hypothetical protein
MQDADPPAGAAQRESRTESEGHSSAASFINLTKVHLPRQRKESHKPVQARLQVAVQPQVADRFKRGGTADQPDRGEEHCTFLHFHCRANPQNVGLSSRSWPDC